MGLMEFFLILLLSLIQNVVLGSDLFKIKVRNDGHFVDSVGRVRIFHGFNAVEKGFPWYPKHMSNESLVKDYKKWGFNAVRLGCMWAGAEPHQGQFNETYLNILREQINGLAEYGVYTILDMHQDVLSKRFGTYDGVPSWLADMLPVPKALESYPWPWSNTKEFQGGNWGLQYLTKGLCVSFQGLYDNHNSTQDHFAMFWKKMAETFKKIPSVLGYELMNEPWAGNVYEDPLLFLPGDAGRKNLVPMYTKLAKSIREADNDTIIMYEPVTWGILFDGNKMGTGFETVPGGPDYTDRSTLSYHLYCWGKSGDRNPLKPRQRIICDNFLTTKVIKDAKKAAQHTGGGRFLTEFGLCQPDGIRNSSNTVMCEFIMDVADQHFASWTYWDSDFYHADGTVRWNVVKAFSRPYPQATAGTPLKFSFDPDKLTMEYSYELDPEIQVPTEIFVPSLHYPKGFIVTLSDQVLYRFDDVNHLLLVFPKKRRKKNTVIEVKIIPKV